MNAPTLPPSKERDAFEAWAKSRHWTVQRNPYNHDVYQSGETQMGWWAWQAARAENEPSADVQMAMALISEVDCHLANAKWEKDATARRKLHQAHALLAPTKGANDAG